MHPAEAKRLAKEKARAELTECVMPLCSSKVLRNFEGRGLGVCLSCSLDIVEYGEVLREQLVMTERKLRRTLRERASQARRDEASISRAAEPGWVYYIRVDKRIKIGYSTDEPVLSHIAKVVEQFGPPPKSFVYTFTDGTRQRIKPHRRSR